MGYNPENGKEVEPKNILPKDTVLDGVIIAIKDGVVKDFVQNLDKWKNKEQPAIEVTVEIKVEEESVQHHQVFTYSNGLNGETEYGKTSNLGKFKRKYESLPKVAQMVKISTNKDGFGTIKLD
jgi:tRNA U54 and U55 pseudouridine synthase Pus10